MVLEYLQTQNKACANLCFSASPPWIGYLSLWMHEGLSSPRFITPRGINATRNMRSRLAIKFPPPMSSEQMPTPRKTKLIKFPPSRAGKDVKCPGYARGWGGGMFKLRFDRYIKPQRHWTLNSLSQILGFGPEPHPHAFHSGMNSLSNTQQFD